MTRRAPVLPIALVLALAATVPSAASDAEPIANRSVVVTTEVLGAVVAEVIGDAADVSVLMDGGADPHAWQASARDTERIFAADLVVANGLGLEEGLIAVLDEAAASGVPVLRATDHVDIIAPRDQDPERVGPGPEEHADGEIGDPHFWLDPLRMRDVVLALAAAFAEAGIDVGGRAQLVAAELESLDAEISAMLSAVPDVQRKLVTGHGSLAYLADRYAFEVIGAVVPGVTTSGEASARDIADLTASIREEGVRAVFSDIGTPASIARSVALDTGARVVELQLARLPEDGTYADLLLDIAGSIRDALSD